MGKLISVRKPRLRLTSRGVSVTRPSVRIGEKVGVNISSRGIRASVHRSRRKSGCFGMALFIILAISVGVIFLF